MILFSIHAVFRHARKLALKVNRIAERKLLFCIMVQEPTAVPIVSITEVVCCTSIEYDTELCHSLDVYWELAAISARVSY